MTLVTIVTEGLLKEQLIAILRRHGATGFTITRTDGEGSRGVRASDWEGPNLRFECIVPHDAGERILQDVGEAFFENYSVIAWLTEVAVLRGDKFGGGK
jgi:hypothetical protein